MAGRASITLEGGAQVLEALRRFGTDGEREVDRAIDATGVDLRGDIIKRILRGPASGRVYSKSNPNRTHQASAPGEAPATDTGRLASSITFERGGRLSVTVGSDLAYAAALEFGTSTIAPRPAWTPAVEAQRPKFLRRLEDAIRRAAERAGQ